MQTEGRDEKKTSVDSYVIEVSVGWSIRGQKSKKIVVFLNSMLRFWGLKRYICKEYGDIQISKGNQRVVDTFYWFNAQMRQYIEFFNAMYYNIFTVCH